ncbi:MAG: hypothetical protein Q4B50_02105 [Bacillota bacterium]|nr:hypothetical protein [Bacillota bacterium]
MNEKQGQIQDDTVKLLKECDSGIRMGISSINDVLDYVKNDDLRNKLAQCREGHEKLREETVVRLCRLHEDGKEPNPIAKGMSWVKTNAKLIANESDSTIADLITDGCNMGVKSLHRYLNQYHQADEGARDIASRLISQELQLTDQMRPYL